MSPIPVYSPIPLVLSPIYCFYHPQKPQRSHRKDGDFRVDDVALETLRWAAEDARGEMLKAIYQLVNGI